MTETGSETKEPKKSRRSTDCYRSMQTLRGRCMDDVKYAIRSRDGQFIMVNVVAIFLLSFSISSNFVFCLQYNRSEDIMMSACVRIRNGATGVPE